MRARGPTRLQIWVDWRIKPSRLDGLHPFYKIGVFIHFTNKRTGFDQRRNEFNDHSYKRTGF